MHKLCNSTWGFFSVSAFYDSNTKSFFVCKGLMFLCNIFGSLYTLIDTKKSKNVILRHNTINPYRIGVKNQNILSFSCGKLRLKLPSWGVICRFNLSYPVLPQLEFFQSFKYRSFYRDSMFWSRNFICSYWPGENTLFFFVLFS